MPTSRTRFHEAPDDDTARAIQTPMSTDLADTIRIVKVDVPVVLTALIVADGHRVLARLQELVAGAGYTVHTAATGVEALRALQECAASIVIMDLKMPGMDGLDLCRRIREQVGVRYVYIVLLTAQDEEQDILTGLEAGADACLTRRMFEIQFTARLRTANRVLALEDSLKNALATKHQFAMTDELTGVFNRRYFLRHLGRELKRTQRFGGDVSMLLLDVDHFKQINDSYGHAVGDRVLQKLTRQIAISLSRATDWCARLGGDEFAVVLEGTKLADARACAEKVCRTIANTPIVTSAGSVRITVSIGVSGSSGIVEGVEATARSLLQHADTNLYASKLCGRNRVTLSDSQGAGAPGKRTRPRS
jgi:diguanylate cyclase (GGDEF)-like protein